MRWRSLLAVVIGGMAGTGLRLGLDQALPHGDSDFPVSTLVINVAGAFTLGLLVARFWPTAPLWLKAGLGPGLLGSFTTYSAFAVSLVALASADEWWLAFVYLLATIVLGFAAAWAGLRLGGTGVSAAGVGSTNRVGSTTGIGSANGVGSTTGIEGVNE